MADLHYPFKAPETMRPYLAPDDNYYMSYMDYTEKQMMKGFNAQLSRGYSLYNNPATPSYTLGYHEPFSAIVEEEKKDNNLLLLLK